MATLVFNVCFRVDAKNPERITNEEVMRGLQNRLDSLASCLNYTAEYDDMAFEYLYDDEDDL